MSVSPVTQIYGTITFLNYIGNDFYISSEKFLGSSSTKIVIEMLVIIFFFLDLIECLMNYGWKIRTLYRRQISRKSPRKKQMQKVKWLSEEALEIAVKRRDVKSKGEKERYTHLQDPLEWTETSGDAWNGGMTMEFLSPFL